MSQWGHWTFLEFDLYQAISVNIIFFRLSRDGLRSNSQNVEFKPCLLIQEVLHIWRPLFWYLFADSKPTEISKNLSKNIKTPSKVMLILKISRVWLKNKARHAHLYFEVKMAVFRLILKLQKSAKNHFSWKK